MLINNGDRKQTNTGNHNSHWLLSAIRILSQNGTESTPLPSTLKVYGMRLAVLTLGAEREQIHSHASYCTCTKGCIPGRCQLTAIVIRMYTYVVTSFKPVSLISNSLTL